MDQELPQPGLPPMPPQMMPGMSMQGAPEGGLPPMPEGMPEPPMMDQNPPEEVAPPTDSKNNSLKKELLQKLMSNLLGKPGRSVNELVNGVKAVMGAYKSYANELDQLSGVSSDGGAPIMSGPPSGAGSSGDIQSILDGIKSQKAPVGDGGGGPGIMIPQNQQMPPLPQTTVPSQIQVNRPPGGQVGILGY